MPWFVGPQMTAVLRIHRTDAHFRPGMRLSRRLSAYALGIRYSEAGRFDLSQRSRELARQQATKQLTQDAYRQEERGS